MIAVALALLIALTSSGLAFAQTPTIKLPPGFAISVFASGLGIPRFLTLDPSGTLLVSIPSQGRVVAVPDATGTAVTVVQGLDRPHGLAWKNGDLYVAETGRVLRFRYDPGARKATAPVVVVPNLPRGGSHWTRTIVFGPDGRLYVSVGSSCNVCREQDRQRAAIVRYNADGTGEELFATGMRNAVGLAFSPATGALWATVNERDWRGDDMPPDYITEVQAHGFYGWPDCIVAGGRAVVDERFGQSGRCSAIALPSVEIQAHSAPLGLAFYTGHQFPPEYHGDLFMAYHGSWNRSVPTGYKVVRMRFKDGKPIGVEDFATGWLQNGRVLGRPVDLIAGRDGALYVSDDSAGQILRIAYRTSP
ncbi:MAG TPA: sorbosone dehydrogenase family protein [Candidatus Methylomirabilis sp.]|nr:sorbosone dehydrogenase family protein [Candidatus Methylomirabilis sp.]